MTIKQQGGIFGRNPTFNKVNVDDSLLINTSEITADVSAGDTVLQISGATGGTGVAPELVLYNSDGNDGALSSISFGGFRSGNAGAVGRISSNRLGIITFGNNDAANNQDTVTDRLTIEEGGDVTVETGNLIIGTSGKGIDFSATSGTGTSELFDDYEEGTWTPTFSDSTSGGTTTGSGVYTKVGNKVTVHGSIDNIDTTGLTGSNKAYILGLPFTSTSSQKVIGNVWFSGGVTTSGACSLYIQDSGTYARFFESPYVSTASILSVSDFTDDAADININATYIVS